MSQSRQSLSRSPRIRNQERESRARGYRVKWLRNVDGWDETLVPPAGLEAQVATEGRTSDEMKSTRTHIVRWLLFSKTVSTFG